ncbi:MAG: putative toxin-antitoxin system toxin component, PIN family [Alphaproteobacteria bacterium]|nr:putative toxin-antitoxin system toxin component, PIN family [Alphaproteobacteria bacterium]
MRAVLDTAVLVAALRSQGGASRQLLVAALERKFTCLASVPLMVEYEAVMTRPEHLEAAGLSPADVGQLLDALALVVQPVRLAYLWRPALRDPDDDMVLETAANGAAEAIVTFNVRDFAGFAQQFGIEVLLPVQAWNRLRFDR